MSSITYRCLSCHQVAVTIRQTFPHWAICAACGFALQSSGVIGPSHGPPEARAKPGPTSVATYRTSRRGGELSKTPLHTECAGCEHQLDAHDFTHVNVRCTTPGCTCWGFRAEDELAA